MAEKLAIADKLLIAAVELENTGKNQFSAEDLVVYAWKIFPEAFGLRGYVDENGKPMYPDSNRVYAEIMGSKPLRKQGLLKKVGSKLYKLTETGRNRVKSVNRHESDQSKKWALSREDQHALGRLLGSRAFKKFCIGKEDEITFFDACGFWGITPASNAKDLWNRFAHVEGVLERSLKAMGSKRSASSMHRGGARTEDELQQIQEVHSLLKEKFSSDLDIIKNRVDERK